MSWTDITVQEMIYAAAIFFAWSHGLSTGLKHHA